MARPVRAQDVVPAPARVQGVQDAVLALALARVQERASVLEQAQDWVLAPELVALAQAQAQAQARPGAAALARVAGVLALAVRVLEARAWAAQAWVVPALAVAASAVRVWVQARSVWVAI